MTNRTELKLKEDVTTTSQILATAEEMLAGALGGQVKLGIREDEGPLLRYRSGLKFHVHRLNILEGSSRLPPSRFGKGAGGLGQNEFYKVLHFHPQL